MREYIFEYVSHLGGIIFALLFFFVLFYKILYSKIDIMVTDYLMHKCEVVLNNDEEQIGKVFAPRYASYAVPYHVWVEVWNSSAAEAQIVEMYTTLNIGYYPTFSSPILGKFHGYRQLELQPQQAGWADLHLALGTEQIRLSDAIKINLVDEKERVETRIQCDSGADTAISINHDMALITAFVDLVLLPPGANYTLIFLSLIAITLWVKRKEELKKELHLLAEAGERARCDFTKEIILNICTIFRVFINMGIPLFGTIGGFEMSLHTKSIFPGLIIVVGFLLLSWLLEQGFCSRFLDWCSRFLD